MGRRRLEVATVVIDVFRAFTTAAFALEPEPTGWCSPPMSMRPCYSPTSITGSLLAGEVGGCPTQTASTWATRPPRCSASARSTGGPLCSAPALGRGRCWQPASLGAEPVLAGSLVVASATGAALADEPEVTLVVAGWNGVEPAEEDEACADLISLLLGGEPSGPG